MLITLPLLAYFGEFVITQPREAGFLGHEDDFWKDTMMYHHFQVAAAASEEMEAEEDLPEGTMEAIADGMLSALAILREQIGPLVDTA